MTPPRLPRCWRPRLFGRSGTLLGAALALGTLGALAAGCKKDEGKGTPPPAVECKPFCEKTFNTCGREVFIASGKLRVDKAKLFNALGLLERVKTEGLEKCLKGCEEHQGAFGDAKAVNACLKIQACEAYAACITKHIQ